MSGSSGVAAVSAAWSTGRNLDSTDPVSIQESIDQLDQLQNQVRIHLFRLLQRLATQPGDGLDQALSQLAAQADKVIAESPEASILPHIGTYQEIVSRILKLTSEISRKQAAEDMEKQVQEFEERLAAGSLSDAAYCCVRLEKMAQDAEEELADREARQQRRQQQGKEEAAGAGGEDAGGEGEGGEDEGGGGGVGPPRVTAESVALLRETAELCSAKLKEHPEVAAFKNAFRRSWLVVTRTHALDGCCAEAVTVDSSACCVAVRSALRGGSVQVAELISASQVLGLQQPLLRQMTDRLVNGALEPMLTSPCCVTVTPAAMPGAAATLAWHPAPPGSGAARPLRQRGSSGGGVDGPCDPEHCCQHLLRLLATWLLEFDEGLMEVFGGPFWRAVADCYIARVARPFIAANPEDVEGCEAVVAAAADLEAMAENLNFTNGEDPYLAPAVESLARHALSNRQEKYLERARQLLKGVPGTTLPPPPSAAAGGGGGGSCWDTVMAGQEVAVDHEYYRRLAAGELQDWEVQDPPSGCRTDGSPLAVGRYLITRRMDECVQLVTGLVEDACAGSRALSRALLSAVASIALMARSGGKGPALITDPPMSSVPQLGLLSVNDLQHLAAMLLLLSQGYGSALEAATGEGVVRVLVGEALQLRAAARVLMREQLRSQYGTLDEILAGLDGLRDVGRSDTKVGQRHRRVVQQLLHSLGRLGRAACEVLTPEDGVALGAAVINHVAGQLVATTMSKGDIAHDECVELGELLGPLVGGAVEAWLASARGAGPDLSGIPLSVVASALTARASQIRKLQCVLHVLRSDTIAHIEQLWDRGELALLAPPELEHLLLAISEDSPGRRAMLQKLRD
ncbi:hypothetical protein VOLCADRAFT_96775 [Volvox carteri f. nagariensis]|uniref:Uncharacterized protein n=1 Tax=Volvox carteri f. nagariensis TaxID=3068 RepID=D8UB08_VOLCA|nr:uncharacterized protein VOLCADRAFT_96775 [Volvox carteri f. nagariensis]EFJ43086.1 hypothetical protein VOLCADRAFT_96775 [Volvox carteri f. nagariensis]|eukprot:XP_002955885.1 hypothetical protein VOLCADRAFT_96775 [Volvox carteri f. nagariensis]